MRITTLSIIAAALVVAGCGKPSDSKPAPPPPPLVRTVTLSGASSATLGLSGTVRARVESPLAFQVPGRIARRAVDAGQPVSAGQLLFELDKRDLEQGVHAAAADLAAAEASLATAEAEVSRNRQLREKNFLSAQATERTQLLRQEAMARRDAAAAALARSRNALAYGRLQAPASGVLTEVSGEPGQVVAAGQTVATLAQSGERELEVYFPDGVTPPKNGEAVLGDGSIAPLQLREIAGAADPQSHTRRVRYKVQARPDTLLLGSVLRARFGGKVADHADFAVTIGAIDERGTGPRVWRVQEGRLAIVPISVLAVNGETARIRGPLVAGDKIVAIGTHLLTANMKVREAPQ